MKNLFSCGCMLLLVLFLAACGGQDANQPDAASTATPSPNTQSAALPAIVSKGTFHEYPLPQTDSGMMRPAVDHEGRIWFGEMSHNYLAVFDPRAQTFQQMVPPNGQSGIMGVKVAPDDTIWFAEQYADYIGHYIPATKKYQVYSLPSLTVPDPSDASKTLTLPSAPNDLELDAHGNVWFTEMNADSLGKLDTRTGNIQQYPLSNNKSVQKLDPYGITVDPKGMVWFTEATASHVGRLDPNSGTISYFQMPGLTTQLMEVASDAQGNLWITSFSTGLLLQFNPGTGTFTPYYAPSGGSGGIYGLALAHGDVWITLGAANMIARLDVASKRFIYYPIPTPTSLPLGIAVAGNRSLWFTEAGKDKVGTLEP